jgi:hypothetical protein
MNNLLQNSLRQFRTKPERLTIEDFFGGEKTPFCDSPFFVIPSGNPSDATF